MFNRSERLAQSEGVLSTPRLAVSGENQTIILGPPAAARVKQDIRCAGYPPA